MTNIQMIALDMDNTLLLPNKTLSEKSTHVLKNYIKMVKNSFNYRSAIS